MRKIKEDWHVLEFSTPIMEKGEVDNEFLIKGTAISETTTHNNHKYVAEELEKAAPNLTGKPLLVDHDNRVEAIKGKITKSFFDPIDRAIKFEAKIMDKHIKEMVKDGRITNVSIGAFAEDLMKDEDDGSFIAKGIKPVELSLVAVPADENATFAKAFADCFSLKEQIMLKEKMHKCPECEKEFESKEEMEKHKEKHKETEKINTYTVERRSNEMEENSSEIQKLKEQLQEMNSMKEELAVLKSEKRQSLITEYQKICAEKNVKEKDITNLSEDVIRLLTEQLREIKIEKEEVKEKKELKSVIKEESSGLDNFMVEKSQKGYSIWIMPDNKGSFAKSW